MSTDLTTTDETTTADATMHAAGDAPPTGRPADARANVMQTLRERRRKADKVKAGVDRLPRPIGVMEDDAVALYKYVAMAEAQRTGARLDKLPDELKAYYAACDTIILANVDLKVRVSDQLVPMDPSGEPLTFDDVQRVLDVLGFYDDLDQQEAEAVALVDEDKLAKVGVERAKLRSLTSRGLLLELFGTEYAVISEAQRISEWMKTLRKGADEAFLDN